MALPFTSATMPLPGFTSAVPAILINSPMGPPECSILPSAGLPSIAGRRSFDFLQQTLDAALGRSCSASLECRRELVGDLTEGLGLRRVRLGDYDRVAGIPAGANGGIDGNPTEEGNAEFLRRPFSPAMGENLGAYPAMAADEKAHVLHDAEQGHVDLLAHHDPLAHVVERHFLTGRHRHRAGQDRKS